MTAQEMAQILRGDREGRSQLFESMLARFMSGDNLTDDELPIFEALKKEFIKPVGGVVEMSATVTAGGKLES